MKHRLIMKDIFALGFMTFALFVGAGNIIFPPMLGLQSGECIWMAAIGFLITTVVLPVMSVIALARVGGSIDELGAPIGKIASMILATICYLTVGPLFATPRTATVSFEVGFSQIIGSDPILLFFYSCFYFIIVIIISLYPGNLLNSVGYILAPLKIVALSILGASALLYPAGGFIHANKSYQQAAFGNGFVNGYLTMDTLGALVFGIVIVNAIRSRGIENNKLLANYTTLAAIIAGIGLTLVYFSLFKLGLRSGGLIDQNANGAVILRAYVYHTFGNMGSFFLAALIFIACIVTGVGLTCACAEFFTQYLPFSYSSLVVSSGIFSMVISNLGLNHLIQFSIPILTAIYPPCIVLVVLSFTVHWWNRSTRIIVPMMLISLLFGVIDALKANSFDFDLFKVIQNLPLSDQKLSWLLPALFVMFFSILFDRIKGSKTH